MIFSSIHANDDLKKYPAAIAKAITYLKETDFENLADLVVSEAEFPKRFCLFVSSHVFPFRPSLRA